MTLRPDAMVEAYSTRRLPGEETRTVEFAGNSEQDIRARLEQWEHEGWKVLSISQPSSQPDGQAKRKADLSRSTSEFSFDRSYDDSLVANIRQGKTTEAELLRSFGPAYSRDLKPDGRMQLAWKFGDWTKTGSATSGDLAVMLDPKGKVNSYSARRGP